MLIIDDDYEMVHYLKMLLEKDYAVDFRYDAVSGYALMTKKMPDIVICDVMMVDVDGYQFCRMVKENDSTSHIPIVLLTAKATIQDQITGLSEGADAYVVKPFNNNYLLTVLSSILENRRRLWKIFQNTTKMPEEAMNGTSDKDKQFLERLYAIMEESLSQGELDVEKWLASERAGSDLCGSMSWCAFCMKAEMYPCAKAELREKIDAALRDIAGEEVGREAADGRAAAEEIAAAQEDAPAGEALERRLAVLTSAAGGGSFATRLHLYQPGEEGELAAADMRAGLGLRCAFTETGAVAVLCNAGVYFVSDRGTLETEYAFHGQTVACADVNGSGCAVVLKKSGNSAENEIIVFDKSGKMMYNNKTVEKADAIALCGGSLFLRQPDGVLRVRCADGSEEKTACVTDRRVMLAVDETRVLLCSPQKAVYYRFGN